MSDDIKPDPFNIGDTSIAPGSAADVKLPVSTTATGVEASLALRVLHGARPGPVMFVSGAVHGDELTGTAVVQQLAREIDPAKLAGTLMLIPVANIFGFLARSRYLPDRRDLNRSFPGFSNGSLAAQLADTFSEHVLNRADIGIDIHTAAEHRYNLPQIRIAAGHPRLTELAMAFGAPVIIESMLRDGTLRALAMERGVDMLLLEAGEALRFDDYAIETGVSGIRRVLAHLGMAQDADQPAHVTVPARAHRTRWIRAPRGGVLDLAKRSGDAVGKGEMLGHVSDIFGEEAEPLVAPMTGLIIGHATLPVVHQGDAMLHIAEIAHPERVGEHIDSIREAIAASEPEGDAQRLLDEDEVI